MLLLKKCRDALVYAALTGLFLFGARSIFASEAQRLGNVNPLGTSRPCATDITKNIPTSLSTSGQPSARAQACLVKVDAAIDALTKGRITIVDTRTASEFEKYRIPGSLNIPAHAVRTKAFLRTQAFLLVDAGHTTAELESVCADLRRSGYSKVSVLQGGLSLWNARGGVVEGNKIAARALSKVLPAELVEAQSAQSQLTKDWLVIDVSGRKNSDVKKIFPGSVSLPWSADHKNNKALLAVINGAGSKRILVMDESGDSYSRIEALPGVQRKDVLYLEGGLRAFLKYQREQVAMWKQRDDPPKRKGCST